MCVDETRESSLAQRAAVCSPSSVHGSRCVGRGLCRPHPQQVSIYLYILNHSVDNRNLAGISNSLQLTNYAFGALTLLVGRQEGHPVCKKTEWWGAGVVICLERDADLHTAQLMPLPLTVACFSKIQIGFTFLVPAHLGIAGQRAVKWVCVIMTTTCSDM